jgi:deoxyribonuclease V
VLTETIQELGLKLCLDVDYRERASVVAGVMFRAWDDSIAFAERRREVEGVPAAYESGQFYKRELPYLLELIGGLQERPQVVVVDGFVWLEGGRAGLGAHLHAALGESCAVVGVAKRPFHGAAATLPLLRGDSQQPLFVSAVGMDLDEAAQSVASMHGPFRIPTLLRRVDELTRLGRG